RRWVRWLGLAALAGVIAQGLFGGLRVTEHARWGLEFRIIHGCLAQIVLALLVSLAVSTSRGWRVGVPSSWPPAFKTHVWFWSVGTASVVYLQVVFGVVLRHDAQPALAQRGHFLVAFLVVAAVAWLLKLVVHDSPVRDRSLTVLVYHLAGLVIVQILLGIE